MNSIEAATSTNQKPTCVFTKRQREVGDLVLKGLTNGEIAEELFVSKWTVKFHITCLYKKAQLQARTREQFIQAFQSRGLVA